MSQENERPSHDVYVVTGEDASHWIRIGSAYPEKDGSGFRLSFDAAPARNGRLVLRNYPSHGTLGVQGDAEAPSPRPADPMPW